MEKEIEIEGRERVRFWGLFCMLVSFVLGTVIAGGSLIALGGRVDTAEMVTAKFALPTALVTCLDPLAILLEIAAIVLLVRSSGPSGSAQRRLAIAAAVCFGLWALLNLGGFLPLSFLGMRQGSLALVRAAQWVKASAALLQYAVPLLLVLRLGGRPLRALLWLALALTVVGNFTMVTWPISSIQLEPVDAGGWMVYTPRFEVDYRAGLYPYLLGMSWAGGVLYMLAYGLLAWGHWRRLRVRGTSQNPAFV